MDKTLKKVISYSYYILLFIVPLAIFPKTSELFEFNKIVITYTISTIILFSWIARMILCKKIIFRRTSIDIPLIVYLFTMIVSTFFSIDIRTSLFGYYSRFNGGLLSIVSYSILYWGFVSNFDSKTAKKAIYSLIFSSILVSFWGVLEHFGFDKQYWVQDVQNRVFSTLGQPNWLAAWLVAIIPITWAYALKSKSEKQKSITQMINIKLLFWFTLSILYFATLLFTKSRSGMLGFGVANLSFWTFALVLPFKSKNVFDFLAHSKFYLYVFLIFNVSYLIFTAVIGTPWTPNISSLVNHKDPDINFPVAPALETGGTESGEIRKIVWKGALEIWKHNPILGTGPETFAYSYYNYRPVEHNLVSEWDFIYNKAHNEYLNFLATSGSLGFAAYIVLISTIILTFVKQLFSNRSKQTEKFYFVTLALSSGFLALIITNFFGFMVVPTSIEFFLYPAMAITLVRESKKARESNKTMKYTLSQKFGIILLCSLALLLFYSIFRYWYADYLYAKGKLFNNQNKYSDARHYLLKATELSKNEAVYYNELSQSATGLAETMFDSGSSDGAIHFSQLAIEESKKAISLSPANLNHRRNLASIYLRLSVIDPDLLPQAGLAISDAIELAPTDAKLYYNLGLVFTRLKKESEAVNILKKAVGLKSNYRDARFALALIYQSQGKKVEAKKELIYILEEINLNDELVKTQLEELK